MKVKKIILLTMIATFVAACSTSMSEHKTNEQWAIAGDFNNASVIVLPFENQTADLVGHVMLREMVFDKFSKWGYHMLLIKEVDEKLKEKGITDGGQLPYVDKDILKKAFGQKIACYGTVESFTFQNLGFIVRKKVVLKIKMVSLADDKIIFENTETGSDTKFYLSKDEAKKVFVRQMALKLVSNMLKSPLRKEAHEAVEKMFKKIPKR
ncbi:MAG: DUF799 family lipoprotein [Elusimicrobia bacterium]|nr:DUF799 family lipoprotein [Elusimicrobiota bacterium]